MFIPIPIPIFIEKFVDKVVNVFEGRTVYEKRTMGGSRNDLVWKKLVKENQNILLQHSVPINKIKFVSQPVFEYDVDNNEINPVYNVFLPLNSSSGRFAKKKPVIDVGKPEKLMNISVGTYKFEDNYEHLKTVLKTTKRGIVIMICDEMVDELFTSEKKQFKCMVSDDCIRYANLDNAVEHFNSFK